MANKRMFSLSVVDTDKFLEMPISSRLLYYELGMRADDDGFVDNWKKILAFTGLKEDDMKVLISKQFIIPFDTGVIVIRHWRMNNYLRNDRYKATQYQEELKKLSIDNNLVYQVDTNGIHSIDKNSIDKNRLDYKEKNTKKEKFKKPTLEEIEEYCKERNSSVDAKTFYEYFETGNWIDSKGNKVKNWKQKLITWEKNTKVKEESSVPYWMQDDWNQEGHFIDDKDYNDEMSKLLSEMGVNNVDNIS